MGAQSNIDVTVFPRQGPHINKHVDVCFHYDTSRQLTGVIVRDDYEEPFLTIIRLDDGRTILATECQYSLKG